MSAKAVVAFLELRKRASSRGVALASCVATLTALMACHGGGGHSPTVPSGVLDAHGDWNVVETVAGGEPQGQCWADHLDALALTGAHGFSRMNVQQNGTAVTIMITATLDADENRKLTGTAGASTLMATQVQGPPDFLGICDNGARYNIRTTSGQLNLTGSPTHLDGEMVDMLELMQGGAVVATVTAHFTVSASR